MQNCTKSLPKSVGNFSFSTEPHGAEWFTIQDLRRDYWQVKPSDRLKTAFTTPYGLYQFRVMPFGLCNAQAHSNG